MYAENLIRIKQRKSKNKITHLNLFQVGENFRKVVILLAFESINGSECGREVFLRVFEEK